MSFLTLHEQNYFGETKNNIHIYDHFPTVMWHRYLINSSEGTVAHVSYKNNVIAAEIMKTNSQFCRNLYAISNRT